MDENLFNVAAALRADSKRAPATKVAAAEVGRSEAGSDRRARQALAFMAALLVNAAVIGVLQWSAAAARPVPGGEVVITQLDSDLEVRVARN